MDAQIFKLVIVPAKIENGEIEKEEYARLTLDIPMNGREQHEAVLELLTFLRTESVNLNIEANQLKFAKIA